MNNLIIAGSAIALAGLVFAESKNSRLGRWIFKPLASTGFILFAISQGAFHSYYGKTIFTALVLAWIGDLLLIPESTVAFQTGVFSFLLGHLVFAFAFTQGGIRIVPTLAAAVFVASIGYFISRWLLPHVRKNDPKMMGPVVAYVLVISIMVAMAFNATVISSNVIILVGAIAFYLSDIAVARDQFVSHQFINRAWGLPMYYLAQFVLSYTIYTESFHNHVSFQILNF